MRYHDEERLLLVLSEEVYLSPSQRAWVQER